jgi:hypothetical protein
MLKSQFKAEHPFGSYGAKIKSAHIFQRGLAGSLGTARDSLALHDCRLLLSSTNTSKHTQEQQFVFRVSKAIRGFIHTRLPHVEKGSFLFGHKHLR